MNARSGFDENKPPTMGSKTGLRHFIRKVEEMVIKLWSLIGQFLVRTTSLRDFCVISSGGSVRTLHFRLRSAKPNFQNEKPGPTSEEPNHTSVDPSPSSVKPGLKT
jgi:hypothetical protein